VQGLSQASGLGNGYYIWIGSVTALKCSSATHLLSFDWTTKPNDLFSSRRGDIDWQRMVEATRSWSASGGKYACFFAKESVKVCRSRMIRALCTE